MRIRSKWLILSGGLVVLLSLGMLLFTEISARKEQREREVLTEQILNMLPAVSNGMLDAESERQMMIWEMQGQDIMGILEFPTLDIQMPLGAIRNEKGMQKWPQRYTGSLYNGSLVIVGDDQKGQLGCLSQLDLCETVSVMDMTGSRFTYSVEWIERKSMITESVFTERDAHLILFVKEKASGQYLIVYCKNEL